MIDPLLFGFFTLASAALVMSPGPFVSLIIAETLKNGRSYGVGAIIGAFFAGLFYFILYYLGAAALLTQLDGVYYTLLQYFGAAYLAWVAIGMLKSSGKIEDTTEITKDRTPKSAAMRGFIICVSSPKTILFFAAFFPQFINSSLPLEPQILIMGLAFLLIGVGSDLMWLAIASYSKAWIYKKGGHSLINKVSGVILLIGAGVILLIQQ